MEPCRAGRSKRQGPAAAGRPISKAASMGQPGAGSKCGAPHGRRAPPCGGLSYSPLSTPGRRTGPWSRLCRGGKGWGGAGRPSECGRPRGARPTTKKKQNQCFKQRSRHNRGLFLFLHTPRHVRPATPGRLALSPRPTGRPGKSLEPCVDRQRKKNDADPLPPRASTHERTSGGAGAGHSSRRSLLSPPFPPRRSPSSRAAPPASAWKSLAS